MGSRARHILLAVCTLAVCVMSCDKTDENGLLDGNWQMTEWRTADGSTIIATNHTLHLYYTVKLNLLKLQIYGEEPTYVLAYFRHTADSLIVTQAFSRPYDDNLPIDSLSIYGCPPDGRFRITALNHSTLMLQSQDAILSFRKY